MDEIDKVIDNKPTAARVRDLAELRIRNLQAFRELEEFNNTGKFMNRHPLVVQFSIREELKKMLSENPDAFLEEYANTRENVKRYRCFLNSKKRSKDQKAKDAINLKKHSDRESLMKEIIGEIK